MSWFNDEDKKIIPPPHRHVWRIIASDSRFQKNTKEGKCTVTVVVLQCNHCGDVVEREVTGKYTTAQLLRKEEDILMEELKQ